MPEEIKAAEFGKFEVPYNPQDIENIKSYIYEKTFKRRLACISKRVLFKAYFEKNRKQIEEDIIQHALLFSLDNAKKIAKKYKPEKGMTFDNYFFMTVEYEVLNYLTKRNFLVKKPSHLNKKEIEENIYVKEVLESGRQFVKVEDRIDICDEDEEGNKSENIDFLLDDESSPVDEEADKNIKIDAIVQCIKKLKKYLGEVELSIFTKKEIYCLTFRKIADDLKISLDTAHTKYKLSFKFIKNCVDVVFLVGDKMPRLGYARVKPELAEDALFSLCKNPAISFDMNNNEEQCNFDNDIIILYAIGSFELVENILEVEHHISHCDLCYNKMLAYRKQKIFIAENKDKIKAILEEEK